MKKIVNQLLPKGQKEIIKKALELQYMAIDGNGLQGEEIEDMKDDIRSLIAFLDYDVSVTLSKDMKDKFSFIHGVDFPEYGDVKPKYSKQEEKVDDRVFQVVWLEPVYKAESKNVDIDFFFNTAGFEEDEREMIGNLHLYGTCHLESIMVRRIK